MATLEKTKSMEMENKFIETFAELQLSLKETKDLGAATDHFHTLVEIFVWAEKKDQTIVDFFIENNMMKYFYELLGRNSKQKNDREIVMKLIKSFSFLLLNLKSPEMSNFVFSNQNFNLFLNFRFDFKDEEVVFFYVNFIKSISQRFDSFPLQIFYNQRHLDLPIFSNVTRFMNHPDSLVRATAFNVVLTLLNCKLISHKSTSCFFA